ncbi:hypothetical protein PPN31114_04541 [Pandoraea pneumonica]|jgi:hypothetical protein|uniref:Uncharacterized protein n=1 Tax=Pandoraea pneumonica TaxID=2508299 RepID=A0A5E4YH79_9BURK|nr:DUF2471 family protein [Pandoraea pneumonica]VVE48169.1 hypothetical protein PPN31114_04541 [Pandoraea pneumonica]
METIDWDQLALSAAERDLAGIVREIAARYAQHAQQESGASARLDWRTLVAIADEAEADIGLHARHEAWVLAHVLRLPGDEVLRREGELPSLDASVDLNWPDATAPAVFRAIVSVFTADETGDDTAADDVTGYANQSSNASPRAASPHAGGSACSA